LAEFIMALDAGTTGIKALVLDPDATVISRAYFEFLQSYPKPGWVEHDPEEIWSATHRVMLRALDEAGKRPDALRAIGITNQRETTLIWDRATGEPVHPAIVWQDRRTAAICERLKRDGLEEELRKRTGLVVDPYFSATKLMWLLDEIDGVRERARAGELAFGTIDSWLLWKLTGGRVHLTEPSNASRTLLYSLRERTWDEWILEQLDIPRALLPDVVASSGRFGETAAGVLDTPVPISGVAGDQQAALCGQACFEPGMVKNTYGTGSFVLMNTGEELRQSTHGLLTSAAWDVGQGPRFALEGSIFVTGAAVQWMRDEMGIISESSDIGPLAESVDDADGTYLVPAFVGLGAPHWDPYARGAYFGISRGTTKAHLARAVVESMAFQTRDVVDAMNADAGVSPLELRVDGGASVMDLLCQFQADQLGITVKRPENLETTALGAGFLAGLAEGVWDSLEEIGDRWTADAEFEPRASRDEVDSAYDGWKRAVDRTLDWVEH
jgi:glycerol kinase